MGKKHMPIERPLTIFLTLVPRVEKFPLPQGARCKRLLYFTLCFFEHCFMRNFNALALIFAAPYIENFPF